MSIFEKKGFIKMLMHNKRDFDAAAARWDEKPRRVRLAEDIFAAMTTHLPLSTDWDVMELGCGTGLLTLRLAPKVGNIVALDGAKGMLSRLEESCGKQRRAMSGQCILTWNGMSCLVGRFIWLPLPCCCTISRTRSR